MVTVAVLLIIAGCAAYQYFKGNIVRGVATVFVTLIASFIAFGYFEYLAKLLIGFESLQSLGAWVYVICFALVFLICFAVFQTGIVALLHEPILLGDLPEKIGRPLVGLFLGWILSGVILVAASMAPLANTIPYARFDERNPNADNPKKAFLNADGLVSGWFAMISKGSFSAISKPQSFALMRASFLDQMYLNRHAINQKVSVLTKEPAIDVPLKAAVWNAPDGLVDEDQKPLAGKAGCRPMIVRINLKKKGLSGHSPFTVAQVRVVCKSSSQGETALQGQGQVVYPIGYMSGKNTVLTRSLKDKVTVSSDAFSRDQSSRPIDFVCLVPNGLTPVLAEFKMNNAALIPAPVTGEAIPAIEPLKLQANAETK
ncbi:MAG: CvpA family protein [Phycisphaerae bacterium]|nr:CvpA family protein [Phycisphaerae bacterium]